MTSREILEKLDAMEGKDGSLPRLLELYRNLLKIQTRIGRELNTPHPGLSSDTISQRITEGQPLLEVGEFVFDWPLLKDTFREMSALFYEYTDILDFTQEEFSNLTDEVLTPEVIRAWYEGRPLPGIKSVSPTLLSELIHAATKPFLTSYSTVLIERIDQKRWRRGYCPVCGGNPDFAYLEKENGARWLVCSRCDTEWLFQRLQCPYCSNTDPKKLSYYTDDKGLYRLYVCDTCKHYIKTIDLRSAGFEVLLPLERLLTYGIDNQAQEYGYSRCS